MILAGIEDDDMWKTGTDRALVVKECASYLLQTGEFDTFAQELQEVLGKVVYSVHDVDPSCRSFKDKLWASFHHVRLTKLPDIWGSFCEATKVPDKYRSEPLLLQYISTKFLEIMVQTEYPSAATTTTVSPPLTDDEENALRYVGGFIIRSLIKKNSHSPHIVMCLNNLTTEDDDHDDYLSYTKAWIEKINRGGLYIISDDVYLVFKSMEIITRKILGSIDKPIKDSVGKKGTIASISSDDDVLFYWSLVTAETPNDIARSVIEKIAELFLTIRGFALAAMYVEEYKRVKQTTIKGTKSLRKELKRKSDNV